MVPKSLFFLLQYLPCNLPCNHYSIKTFYKFEILDCETGLSPPLNYSIDRSKAVVLLWIIYVISVLFLLCFRACLFIDALWSHDGKGLTLGSRL